MRSLDSWLGEYQESHSHPINQIIHKVCVPLIFFSTLGLFTLIPTPSFFGEINFAHLLALGGLIFYFRVSKYVFAWMFFIIAFNFYLVEMFNRAGSLASISASIFIVAWIVQIYGHKVEGKKPSFFKDLAFLFVGPIWVLKAFLKVTGIERITHKSI